MQIGELAERTNLSLRTLRHYDEVGLLHPSGRTEGGFRIYSEQDYRQLVLIRQARALGFSLDEIAELLDALARRTSSAGAPDEELAGFLREAQRRRDTLEENLGRADHFIELMSSRLSGH